MRGAGFLGSGTYGCAVSPPIRCQGDEEVKHKDAVGKLFRSAKDFAAEKRIAKLVEKLDPGNEFSLPTYGDCSVPIKNIGPDDEPDKCRFVARSGKRAMKQLIYKHGGVELTSVLRNMEGGHLYLETLVPLMRPLFVGLKRLSDKGFVHMDIKPDNITLNRADEKFYIIDFGMMTSQAAMYTEPKNRQFWTYSYQPFPPSFKLFYLLKRDELHRYSWEQFKNYFGENLHYITYEDLPQHTEDLRLWFEYAKSHPVKATEIIQSSANKIDTYSMGMVLLMVINKFRKHNRIRNPALAEALGALAMEMVDFDERKRITADYALAKYDTIVKASRLSVRTIPAKYQVKMDRTTTKPWEDMTLRELREWCDKIGVRTDGKRAELCNLLVKYT